MPKSEVRNMVKERELALIREIIADGYENLDAISFELDIPMVTLVEIKRQVELEKKNQKTKAEAERSIQNERYESIQRLGQLRRNYEFIYNGLNTKSEHKKIPQETPDNPVASTTIERIETIVENDKSVKNRLVSVLKELENIKNESISLNQAERIISIIMDRQKLPVPDVDSSGVMNYTIKTYKKIMIKKLVEGVKVKLELTNDVKELARLNRVLSSVVEQADYVLVAPVKMCIQSKISKIQIEKRNYDMENNFSEDILTILNNFAAKDMKEEEIDQAIENEVQRRISNNTSIYPGMDSVEKQRVQVYYKLVKAMERLAEEYPIERADKVIEVLEKKFGMGFDSNLRAVISNYIERNQFVAANYICDRFIKTMSSDDERSNRINRVKSDIMRAEIGQIILRGIQASATEQEQNQFFDVLERKMKQHRYGYSLIPLGRTKDGMKKITLDDIWGDDRAINR